MFSGRIERDCGVECLCGRVLASLAACWLHASGVPFIGSPSDLVRLVRHSARAYEHRKSHAKAHADSDK